MVSGVELLLEEAIDSVKTESVSEVAKDVSHMAKDVSHMVKDAGT